MLRGFQMELLQKLVKSYSSASKKEKTSLLDQYVKLTGSTRYTAVKRFGRYIAPDRRAGSKKKPSGRKPKYDRMCVLLVTDIFNLSGQICAERIFPAIDIYMKQLENNGLLGNYSRQTINLVNNVSLGSLKKITAGIPKPSHKKHKGKCDIYRKIPVMADFNGYARTGPGYLEVDFVEHNGGNSSGRFAYTANYVDLYSQWISRSCALGKNLCSVRLTHDLALKKIPFPALHYHPDNDKSILALLLNDIEKNKKKFKLSRSRPFRKNDNAYVEQKNGDKIRLLVGYHRYDTGRESNLLNRIYDLADLIDNYFTPSMKLKEKITDKHGRVLRRIYELAETPYRRLMASGKTGTEVRERIERTYKSLNLVELRGKLNALLEELNGCVVAKNEGFSRTLVNI